jgi:hypothetical protein
MIPGRRDGDIFLKRIERDGEAAPSLRRALGASSISADGRVVVAHARGDLRHGKCAQHFDFLSATSKHETGSVF